MAYRSDKLIIVAISNCLKDIAIYHIYVLILLPQSSMNNSNSNNPSNEDEAHLSLDAPQDIVKGDVRRRTKKTKRAVDTAIASSGEAERQMEEDPKSLELKTLWEQLITTEPTAYNFLEIIENVEALRMKAWEKLQRMSPDMDALAAVLSTAHVCGDESLFGEAAALYVPQLSEKALLNCHFSKLRPMASQELLKRETTSNEALASLMLVGGEGIGRQAADKLLKRRPTSDQLLDMIRLLPDLEKDAGLLLLAKRPSSSTLIEIMRRSPMFREEAWALFVAEHPNHLELRSVMRIESLQERAGSMILSQDPTRESVFDVLFNVPSLEEQAWQLYDDQTHDIGKNSMDLHKIICNAESPTIRERAANILMHTHPSDENLQLIAKHVELLREQAETILRRRFLMSEILKKAQS